jgi:uncharacterized protein DUF1616
LPRITLRSSSLPGGEGSLGFAGELESQGVVVFSGKCPESFLAFLADRDRVPWLYASTILSLAESLLVIYGSQAQPFALLRLVLGLVLLGFAPGYLAVRAIFPLHPPSTLEMLILSIFFSVMISIGIGTILGASSLFQGESNVLLLAFVTICMGLIAAHRTFTMSKKQGRIRPVPAPVND